MIREEDNLEDRLKSLRTQLDNLKRNRETCAQADQNQFDLRIRSVQREISFLPRVQPDTASNYRRYVRNG